MSKLIASAAFGLVAIAISGCSEPSQDPARSYAGKEDAKAYSGDAFKGDKAKWEAALAERAGMQNDYAPFRAAGLKKQ
jgi:hypothetical protein